MVRNRGEAVIREEAIVDGRTDTAGLVLLFRKEERPDRAAVVRAVAAIENATVSFDPGASGSVGMPGWAAGMTGDGNAESDGWLELLADGLTFDLLGLGPGPSVSAPGVEFHIDCPRSLSLNDYGLIGLAPGPHLVGGMRSLVVARALVGLGCSLANALGNVQGFSWLPSRALTGPEFFCSTVSSWIAGGPFPALGLTAFRALGDGALESVGLDFFTGQEVRVGAELAGDPASATRLAMRLVHQLATYGRLDSSELITGPDGTQLQLVPLAKEKVVLVKSA